MNAKAKQNGFTIIEVVLVLAIAALIFLMIFIAWPALQRTQRDTARKNDANTVASVVANYRSNHSGSFPANAQKIAELIQGSSSGKLSQYEVSVGDNGATSGIEMTTASASVTAKDINTIEVVTGAKCTTDKAGATNADATVRNAAVLIKLETNDTTCQDV